MTSARPVAILGGVRIPFCRQNTAYSDVGNLGMSVRTLGALVERFGLHGQQLGEVAMGAVIKHPSDWNLGREAALSSGLSPLTPGITLQRACGTSLDTIITVANKIALGQIESGIGGGSDTTSDRLWQEAARTPAGGQPRQEHRRQAPRADQGLQVLRAQARVPRRGRAAYRQEHG
jgi:acetyl-CoA C-acetyltransferase